ncbi:MAG: hypothetical protein IJM53_01995 [Lachnospiraceae bacterium]|nr:hypothetical protein [Lachnospiraceae bacterium]
MKQNIKRPEIAMIILAAVVFAAGRIAFYLSGEVIWVTSVSKAVMTMIIMIIAISVFSRKRTRFNAFILAAIAVYCAADIMINISFPVGMGLFALGHIVFLVGSLIENHKIKPLQIILFAVVAVIIVAGFIILRKMIPAQLFLPALIYAILLITAWASVFNKGLLLRIGYSIFVISDMMLALNAVLKGNIIVAVTELAIYYVALVLFSFSMLREK